MWLSPIYCGSAVATSFYLFGVRSNEKWKNVWVTRLFGFLLLLLFICLFFVLFFVCLGFFGVGWGGGGGGGHTGYDTYLWWDWVVLRRRQPAYNHRLTHLDRLRCQPWEAKRKGTIAILPWSPAGEGRPCTVHTAMRCWLSEADLSSFVYTCFLSLKPWHVHIAKYACTIL